MPYFLLAVIVTAIVVLLAWRGLSNSDEGGAAGGPGTRPPVLRQKNRAPRILAPDDDPDFLNEIDRRMRGEDKSS